MSRLEIGDEELGAYVDGELDGARHLEIERLMQSDPALAEKAAALKSDMAFLRALYAPIAAQPLPASWRARIQDWDGRTRSGSSASRQNRSGVAGADRAAPSHAGWKPAVTAALALAAAIVLAVICVPLAVRHWPSPRNPDIVAEALAAQSGSVAPQSALMTTARDIASRAISEALAMRLKAPDLSRMGYSLEAVKTYSGARGNQPVELVYRNARSGWFTLYLHRTVGAPRFDQFRQGRERICIWQDDVLGTVMVGEMSAPEMQRLASLSYTGLTL
jgi:anti-sigma factor RsiW